MRAMQPLDDTAMIKRTLVSITGADSHACHHEADLGGVLVSYIPFLTWMSVTQLWDCLEHVHTALFSDSGPDWYITSPYSDHRS